MTNQRLKDIFKRKISKYRGDVSTEETVEDVSFLDIDWEDMDFVLIATT